LESEPDVERGERRHRESDPALARGQAHTS
jgi:hypothetical protein